MVEAVKAEHAKGDADLERLSERLAEAAQQQAEHEGRYRALVASASDALAKFHGQEMPLLLESYHRLRAERGTALGTALRGYATALGDAAAATGAADGCLAAAAAHVAPALPGCALAAVEAPLLESGKEIGFEPLPKRRSRPRRAAQPPNPTAAAAAAAAGVAVTSDGTPIATISPSAVAGGAAAAAGGGEQGGKARVAEARRRRRLLLAGRAAEAEQPQPSAESRRKEGGPGGVESPVRERTGNPLLSLLLGLDDGDEEEGEASSSDDEESSSGTTASSSSSDAVSRTNVPLWAQMISGNDRAAGPRRRRPRPVSRTTVAEPSGLHSHSKTASNHWWCEQANPRLGW